MVDRLCERPAIATDVKFHGQLSDAAASGPRNIAEGFGRYYHPEFARFARIAKSSEQESPQSPLSRPKPQLHYARRIRRRGMGGEKSTQSGQRPHSLSRRHARIRQKITLRTLRQPVLRPCTFAPLCTRAPSHLVHPVHPKCTLLHPVHLVHPVHLRTLCTSCTVCTLCTHPDPGGSLSESRDQQSRKNRRCTGDLIARDQLADPNRRDDHRDDRRQVAYIRCASRQVFEAGIPDPVGHVQRQERGRKHQEPAESRHRRPSRPAESAHHQQASSRPPRR